MISSPNSSIAAGFPLPNAESFQRMMAGAVAACILLPMEWVSLGVPRLSLYWTSATLMIGLGIVVALIIDGQERLIQRYELTSIPASCVRASGSLLATGPLSSGLFDGAYASTLPGATSAWLWMPLFLSTGLALVLWGVDYLMRLDHFESPLQERRSVVLIVGLMTLCFLCELTNRLVLPSEYPAIHTCAVVVALTGVYLVLRMLGFRSPNLLQSFHHHVKQLQPNIRYSSSVMTSVGIGALNFLFVLVWGLAGSEARLQLATQGLHSRWLVDAVRQVMDFDGDGFAAVLGGVDCNDLDDTRNPNASEIPGNSVDENCDGLILPAKPVVTAGKQDLAKLSNDWHRSEFVQAEIRPYQQQSIVWIVVDALRADSLADNQLNRHDFPNFFRILDPSQHFELAFSPAAGTDLSLATLITGKLDAFAPTSKTLLEAMADTGRATHAVLPREVIRYAGKTILTRGLDSYNRVINDPIERDIGNISSSEKITNFGLRFIDSHQKSNPDRPFFLWLHYFDVHEHDELKIRRRRTPSSSATNPMTPARSRYRDAVSLTDQALGKFLDGLMSRQLSDKITIVLLSDHGESLGEDPRLPDHHGLVLYNPLVHVPMAIYLPGKFGQSINYPVSLSDLTPTLLHLAGSNLSMKCDGKSLLPLMFSRAPKALIEEPRTIAFSESDQRGLIEWPYKLLRRPKENITEMFDLSNDFGEMNDISASHRQKSQELLAKLSQLPALVIDRTRKGRRKRERAAKQGAISKKP